MFLSTWTRYTSLVLSWILYVSTRSGFTRTRPRHQITTTSPRSRWTSQTMAPPSRTSSTNDATGTTKKVCSRRPSANRRCSLRCRRRTPWEEQAPHEGHELGGAETRPAAVPAAGQEEIMFFLVLILLDQGERTKVPSLLSLFPMRKNCKWTETHAQEK